MSTPESVFPANAGNKLNWTLLCTTEYLDDSRMVQGIVNRLMEHLLNETRSPKFREDDTGSVEVVAESIEWLFERLNVGAGDLRQQVKELRQEGRA